MISPTKHTNPDQTVVNASMVILRFLRKKRLRAFDDLRKHLSEKIPHSSPLFLPALHFLFMLGLVEYHPKTDSFEYAGPNA
jgi:hypothetical protein